MGYYTQFTIQIFDKNGKDLTDEIQDESEIDDILLSLDKYPESMKSLVSELKQDSFYGLLSEQACKWYDHEEVLTELSKKYPKFVFRLFGNGEEQGDMWMKYFYNGKVSFVQPSLQWPDFSIEEFTKGE